PLRSARQRPLRPGLLPGRRHPGPAPACAGRALPGGRGGQLPGHGGPLPGIPAGPGRHVSGAAAGHGDGGRYPAARLPTVLAGGDELHPAIRRSRAAPRTAGAHPPGAAAGRRADPVREAALRGRRRPGAAHRAAPGLQARQRLQRAGNRPEAQRHRARHAARHPGTASATPAGRRLHPGGALVPVSQFRLADRPAMIDLASLVRTLTGTPLSAWAEQLPRRFAETLARGHGDLPRWQQALADLPALPARSVELAERFARDGDCDTAQRERLRAALMALSPWRKGPFELFGIHVDTEWRSDWKWARVAPHLDLRGKRALAVGCGNGYYMWRMLGAGADC